MLRRGPWPRYGRNRPRWPCSPGRRGTRLAVLYRPACGVAAGRIGWKVTGVPSAPGTAHVPYCTRRHPGPNRHLLSSGASRRSAGRYDHCRGDSLLQPTHLADVVFYIAHTAPGAAGFQVAEYPAIRNLLLNASVNDLNNTGLPFSGTFNDAFQWNLTVPGSRRQACHGRRRDSRG